MTELIMEEKPFTEKRTKTSISHFEVLDDWG